MPHPIFISGDQLVGRTVERVIDTTDEIFMKFADGTFTGIRFQRDPYEPAGYGSLVFFEPCNDRDLMQLGIMTEAEYEAKRKAEDEKRAREAKEQRRREWQRLNQEFGGAKRP